MNFRFPKKCNEKIVIISAQKSKKSSNQKNEESFIQIVPNKYNYEHLFHQFDHFLYFSADMLTIFLLQFWKILDIKISF